MNFTREPIIETVVSAKEGFRLVLRSSKQTGQEEYSVDAVEVVSFGRSFFFRSLERSKAFLLPVTDYEVVEVKEVRVALKHAHFEKGIKIGGGKDGSKSGKESDKGDDEGSAEVAVVSDSEGKKADVRKEKKRGRRRGKGGRSDYPEKPLAETPGESEIHVSPGEEERPSTLLSAEYMSEEIPPIEEGMIEPAGELTEPVAPIASAPVFKGRLIPPPSQLISGKLFKELAPESEESVTPQEVAHDTEEPDLVSSELTKDLQDDLLSEQLPGSTLENRGLEQPADGDTLHSLRQMIVSSFGKFW